MGFCLSLSAISSNRMRHMSRMPSNMVTSQRNTASWVINWRGEWGGEREGGRVGEGREGEKEGEVNETHCKTSQQPKGLPC